MPNHTPEYESIREDGFAVFPNVLDRHLLGRLRLVTDRLLDEQPQSVREQFRYQGSNIPLKFQDPVFAELIAWPKSLECLAQVGFEHPKFWMGYIISKPPKGPPLYWHQDWPFWNHPISASPHPAQLFLMYYLTDTTRQNGCLRVIPGSHRKRVPIHSQLPPAHSPETLNADRASVIFAAQPEEVDVMVKAGDLVMGDARTLHAAHANDSDENRTVLTLWYFPAFETLPAEIQADVVRGVLPTPAGAPERDRRLIEPLAPRFGGTAKPIKWDRVPGEYLGVS